MITFVIYYVPLPRETVMSAEILPKFHRIGFNYERMLELAYMSALLFHPDCKLVLLTSLEYQPDISPQLRQKINIFRCDVDPNQPMIGRTQAEWEYLQKHDFTSDVIMMDGDILINANLESLFDEDFDVTLTYRKKRKKIQQRPFSAGLKLIHRHKKDGALSFFKKVRDLSYSEQLKEYRTWWGDELALSEAVGLDNFFQRKAENIRVDNSNIRFLPCDPYHFMYDDKFRKIWGELTDKKVIHFGRSTKYCMPIYWDLYLNKHNNEGVICKLKKMSLLAIIYAKIRLRLM